VEYITKEVLLHRETAGMRAGTALSPMPAVCPPEDGDKGMRD